VGVDVGVGVGVEVNVGVDVGVGVQVDVRVGVGAAAVRVAAAAFSTATKVAIGSGVGVGPRAQPPNVINAVVNMRTKTRQRRIILLLVALQCETSVWSRREVMRNQSEMGLGARL
jgi:hypothetical protein